MRVTREGCWYQASTAGGYEEPFTADPGSLPSAVALLKSADVESEAHKNSSHHGYQEKGGFEAAAGVEESTDCKSSEHSPDNGDYPENARCQAMVLFSQARQLNN